jgi:acetyl-CoA carboxylase biotin carboxyl carrier protein
MNLKQIQELIKFVAKSGATEVDLEMGDVKISIKSPPKGKFSQDLPIINPITIRPPQVVSDHNVDKVENTDQYITVKSPIIGTFYRRSSPDQDPFVNIGDKIDVGTVIAIVEAMKLFNEIESEISGTIVKVLIDDMSPVEYDQPLFLVDPN